MSTQIVYPKLPFYEQFWHPNPRIRVEGRFHRAINAALGQELVALGRQIGGQELDEHAALRKAKAGRGCHCRQHIGTYPRCLFESPQDVGEVFCNGIKTGLPGAELIAKMSAGLDHQADDVWCVLGIGSGVDVLGLEDGRGSRIEHLLGIDLSDVALRVASALHPQLICGKSIDDIALPPGNRLHVLSSLVFNYASAEVARNWARVIASGRSELVWINVGYHPDSSGEQGTRWVAEQELRSLGFSVSRQPIEEAHRCEVSKGGQFVSEAVLWRR